MLKEGKCSKQASAESTGTEWAAAARYRDYMRRSLALTCCVQYLGGLAQRERESKRGALWLEMETQDRPKTTSSRHSSIPTWSPREKRLLPPSLQSLQPLDSGVCSLKVQPLSPGRATCSLSEPPRGFNRQHVSMYRGYPERRKRIQSHLYHVA